MLGPVWLRHKNRDIFPQDLIYSVPKHLFSRLIERINQPFFIGCDNGTHRRLKNGSNARFTGRELSRPQGHLFFNALILGKKIVSFGDCFKTMGKQHGDKKAGNNDQPNQPIALQIIQVPQGRLKNKTPSAITDDKLGFKLGAAPPRDHCTVIAFSADIKVPGVERVCDIVHPQFQPLDMVLTENTLYHLSYSEHPYGKPTQIVLALPKGSRGAFVNRHKHKNAKLNARLLDKGNRLRGNQLTSISCLFQSGIATGMGSEVKSQGGLVARIGFHIKNGKIDGPFLGLPYATLTVYFGNAKFRKTA